MERPRASPLQIPPEDDVPLFDPSGLSASLSQDDWHNSFDLSSVAAARLGIGSPPSHDGSSSFSRAGSLANLTRSDSRNPTNTETNATSNHQRTTSSSRSNSYDVANDASKLAAEQDQAKRGRRRKSSVGREDGQTGTSGAGSSALPQKDTSVGSKVRMWWERSAAGTPEAESNDASMIDHGAKFPALPSLNTDVSPAGPSNPPKPEFTSPATTSQESFSPVVRSPAADFLSAFSSLNSVIQPATSYDNRSLSYSPPRSGQRGLGDSLMQGDARNGAAAAPGLTSWRGLGSAAAQLYDNQLTTALNPPPRSDDEGARVGPSGRYLLGKTIGFGGFSTVREGWDLEAQGPADPTAPIVDGVRKGRKVAVKVVYHHHQHKDAQSRDPPIKQQKQCSQELHIWKSLPTHQHLLPLLHHECVNLDGPHAENNRANGTTAELLIMPFCDQGNLLDFVRSEGGASNVIIAANGQQLFASEDRRSESGSWVASGSVRSANHLSRSSSLKTSMDSADPSWRNSGSRTGSGFVLPRNTASYGLGRVASVSAASQLRTIPAGQETSSVASSPASAAGSASSGSRLVRRTTSRISRSQGIPIDAARETMRQLASAISTLHKKSHVLHGDLKLENVLGQDQTSWKKRQRTPSNQPEDEAEGHSRQNSAGLTDSVGSLAASSFSSRQTLDVTDVVMPCWRIADFGLAQVLDPSHAKSVKPGASAIIRALKEEVSQTANPQNSGNKKGSKSRGGSLAYTAPEFLRAQGTPGSNSPAVAQTPEDEDELPPESPFAADMWALGCILYALLSGKLPFSDSFEPRLQMKIAKGHWELPPRLRRRAERLAASTSTSTLTSQLSTSNRNTSTDRAGTSDPPNAADRFAFSQRRGSSGAPRGPRSFTAIDLSASLPSLLPRERQSTEPAPSAMPRRVVAVHSDQVVGSAPGRADHLESFEINEAAKARADIEEDPESDEDSDVDPSWNGLSWDRAAARQVLRGLLEPDPRRRWTIDKLCCSAWIRQEGVEPIPSPAGIPINLVQSNTAIHPSGQSASTSTTTGISSTKGFSVERTGWSTAMPTARQSNDAISSTLDASAAPSFDKTNVDEHFQRQERGRRSSSLARTRPVQLAHDSSSSASPARSPAVSMDEDDSAKRRSRSTSRISLRYRDSSRNRSTDVSGSSTPNRERDPAWMSHNLGSSLNSQHSQWVHAAIKDRCDSPSESERRGRLPRFRMADLDENTTWNGEDDTSSDSRAGSSLHRTVPIAIRGSSHSRSRSRHSRESASPERFTQRSSSRSRSTHSLSHESGPAGGLLYGRSVEVQPAMAPIMADPAQAQRSSTARSRSRAPDALAQILGRQRSRSRSRVRSGLEGPAVTSRSTPSLYPVNSNGRVSAAMEDDKLSTDSERETHEARGRARDRR